MKTLLETKIDFPCTVKVSQRENGTIVHEIIPENEFKEGDILVCKDDCDLILIFKETSQKPYCFHSYYNTNNQNNFNWVLTCFRLATSAEQQRLFAALKKDGKRWNAEKKCIEDLPEEPKVGDIVVAWSSGNKEETIIGKLIVSNKGVLPYFVGGAWYKNVTKWDGTKEHLERVRKGEL